MTCLPNISMDVITLSCGTVSVAIRNCSSSTPASPSRAIRAWAAGEVFHSSVGHSSPLFHVRELEPKRRHCSIRQLVGEGSHERMIHPRARAMR